MNALNSPLPVPAPARSDWNPWPVALVTFLSLFVLAVIGFGIFATRHSQELVRPDYYDQEIRYQEQIDRVARTQALAGSVELKLETDGQTLSLRIPGAAVGNVHLYRPSDSTLDRDFPLSTGEDGRQRLDLRGFKPGNWKARMTWSQGGQEFFHDTALVVP